MEFLFFSFRHQQEWSTFGLDWNEGSIDSKLLSIGKKVMCMYRDQDPVEMSLHPDTNSPVVSVKNVKIAALFAMPSESGVVVCDRYLNQCLKNVDTGERFDLETNSLFGYNEDGDTEDEEFIIRYCGITSGLFWAITCPDSPYFNPRIGVWDLTGQNKKKKLLETKQLPFAVRDIKDAVARDPTQVVCLLENGSIQACNIERGKLLNLKTIGGPNSEKTFEIMSADQVLAKEHGMYTVRSLEEVVNPSGVSMAVRKPKGVSRQPAGVHKR